VVVVALHCHQLHIKTQQAAENWTASSGKQGSRTTAACPPPLSPARQRRTLTLYAELQAHAAVDSQHLQPACRRERLNQQIKGLVILQASGIAHGQHTQACQVGAGRDGRTLHRRGTMEEEQYWVAASLQPSLAPGSKLVR
jgi:hypothetical protein